MASKRKPITIEVLYGCARCGAEEHEGLEFQPLTNPIHVLDAFELTHWCPCPENGEPIVLRLEEPAKRSRGPRGTAQVAT